MSCLCKCRSSAVSPTHMGDQDVEQASTSFIAAGKDCYELAKETVNLCEGTVAKGDEIVDFGRNIKETLTSMAENMDASALATIRDLVDGDNVRAAQALAGEMDDLALACVQKAVAMIKRMQEGVDALPEKVKKFVENRASKIEASQEEKEMADVEPDIEELKTAIDAVKNLNLATAMEAGVNAFNGISSKADVCKTLFEAIKKFATSMVTITDALVNMNIRTVLTKAKDILRCISLGGLMKKFAEEVGKLIKVIIELFQEASGKLGKLWSALAYAKDCLSECASEALRTKQKFSEARGNADDLVEKTENISEAFTSLSSLRSVVGGTDIQDTIFIAEHMDDTVVECTRNVSNMVVKVTEGYNNLPDIVTDGIADMKEAGKAEDDPEPADVEEDIADLERARAAVLDSDVKKAVVASKDGLSGVKEKAAVCRDMLARSEEFIDNYVATVNSFMGAWNISEATGKIVEMCRLVNLGEMIKQFAQQTKKLLMAIVALIRAIEDKLKNAITNFPAVANFLSCGALRTLASKAY